MDKILGVMGRVPTVIWIIIGVVFVLPLLWGAFKKGVKALGYVAIFVALLFIFPSIGSSFMKEAQLTWDEETKTLINRNGTSISMDDILEKGKEVKDMTVEAIKDAKDIMDILGEGGAGGSVADNNDVVKDESVYVKEDNALEEDNAGFTQIEVTPEMIDAGKSIGLMLSEKTVIIKKDGSYYLWVDNESTIKLSDDMVKAIGLGK